MGNVAVIIKPIKAQFGNPEEVTKAIREAQHREGERIKRDLEKTVKTWKNKPKFTYVSEFKGGDAVMMVGPSGPSQEATIWGYLEAGTRVRWAVMSKDYRSKTSPGGWDSGQGGGRVVIAGKKAMMKRGIRPRPGIQARRWLDTVVHRNRSHYREALEKAIQESTKKVMGSK